MQRRQRRRGGRKDHVGGHFHQLGRRASEALFITARPTRFDGKVATQRPAQLLHLRLESCEPPFHLRVTLGKRRQEADAPHAIWLLRPRRKRPRSHAKQRDELATLDHSITSSARCWRNQGTSRPSDLAVLRLTTSSNLVGACTGRSPGFSPRRTRSTYAAAS